MTVRRLGRWLAIALAALCAGAVGLVALYVRALAVPAEGRWSVDGPRAAIRIQRDDDGIPTIEAGSQRDALYALGVVHAQDRLWQLELHRRIGAGRLAELFGERALDSDRFLRALGVRRAAAAQWRRLGAASREALAAYADGVNTVIARQGRWLPPEFLLLGCRPEPWTPIDSLAWAILLAWDLGGNWNSELLRMRLALRLPVARIDELLPPYPGQAPVPVADYAALYRGLGIGPEAGRITESAAPPSGVEGLGSNNWVLAGGRSATGSPLLANDPHLRLSAPALWHPVRIRAPGFELAGATVPGLPAVLLGQNRRIAWGLTNTGPDVQDLYLEQIDPADPGRYRTPDGSAAFEAFPETIRVKGRADVAFVARATRHGPVISDAAGVADGLTGPAARPAYVLAMRWTALDADVDPIGPMLAIDRAGSVEAFVAAAEGWVAPMQNAVVADVDGRIGFVAAGRVPVRGPQNDLHGLVPAPGWDARYDWVGWVPAGATPRAFDPPRGFIATANQRIVPPGYPYFLTSEWTLPFRQQRIEALLAARDRHTLDDLAAIQGDVQSLEAAALLPWFRAARADHPLSGPVAPLIAAFDGRMEARAAAPLIFWAWARQLTLRVFADEIGPDRIDRVLSGRTLRDALAGVLARDDRFWCDDRRTPLRETCAMLNDEALRLALDELAARHGADPARWHWGEAHQARAEHRPFSRVGALAPLFELRAPAPGDTFTIDAGRVSLVPDPRTGELYLNEHGPSYRGLYDLADPARSRFVTSTGPSALPWSLAYRRFFAKWARNETLALWDPERKRAGGLELVPR